MADVVEFSVILPVCHGGRFLEAALASLLRMDYPPECVEVIAAVADSERDSAAVAQAAERATLPVHCVGVPAGRRAVRLNAACAAARGQVLVFGDDDGLFPSDWLRRLHHATRRPMVDFSWFRPDPPIRK